MGANHALVETVATINIFGLDRFTYLAACRCYYSSVVTLEPEARIIS